MPVLQAQFREYYSTMQNSLIYFAGKNGPKKSIGRN